jgi:hypothetical protein
MLLCAWCKLCPSKDSSCCVPSFNLLPQASLSLSKLCTPCPILFKPSDQGAHHAAAFYVISRPFESSLLRSHCLSALRATFPCFASPFRTPYSLADAPFASLYIAIDHLADIARFPRFPISLAGLVRSPLDPFSLAELSAAPSYSALSMPSLHTLPCYTL